MTITLRPAQLSDLDEMQSVFQRASMSNERDRQLLLEHPEWLQQSDGAIKQGRTRVAVDEEGTLVGFATYRITNETAELEDLFVDPSHMRHGIATALVGDIARQLRDMNYATMEVTANWHAMSFYLEVGFEPEQLVETEGGPALRMQRTIN
jgi:GNAT superfamily N-acetyltransferase